MVLVLDELLEYWRSNNNNFEVTSPTSPHFINKSIHFSFHLTSHRSKLKQFSIRRSKCCKDGILLNKARQDIYMEDASDIYICQSKIMYKISEKYFVVAEKKYFPF